MEFPLPFTANQRDAIIIISSTFPKTSNDPVTMGSPTLEELHRLLSVMECFPFLAHSFFIKFVFLLLWIIYLHFTEFLCARDKAGIYHDDLSEVLPSVAANDEWYMQHLQKIEEGAKEEAGETTSRVNHELEIDFKP